MKTKKQFRSCCQCNSFNRSLSAS